MDETLQEKIERAIGVTGMTYKDLAKELGVSFHNFYKWKGSSNPRDHKEYQRVMNSLDVILQKPSPGKMFEKTAGKPLTETNQSKQSVQPLLVCIFLSGGDKPQAYVNE